MPKLLSLAATLPVLAAGCGGAALEPESGPPAPTGQPVAATVEPCPPLDLPAPVGEEGLSEADLAWQEDAAAAAAAVERYGQRHRSEYGGVWLDHETRGVTAAFTSSLDAHRSALDVVVPGAVPWRVLHVDFSAAELERLANRVRTEATDLAWNANGIILDNRVHVDVKLLDAPTLEALAARFPGAPLCAEGPTPEEIVPEGPQAQAGRGWRLLADKAGAGAPWDTAIARGTREYERLWDELGLAGTPPAVDFEREVVVHFGVAVSSSCPDIRLDEVLVEGDRVRPLIVRPGLQQPACNADANPHAYVLAVERDALPPTPFRLRITDCETCNDSDVTVVETLGA